MDGGGIPAENGNYFSQVEIISGITSSLLGSHARPIMLL
jgi:hypothetical protein